MSEETPETLLKSALERIVYFEARSTQLSNDVERSRGEIERLKAELARAAQREIELKRSFAELEVRVACAEAERDEATLLSNALRRERADLVANIVDASRIHGSEVVDGFDLAQFIAQLRSEVLRTRADTDAAADAARGGAARGCDGPAVSRPQEPVSAEGDPATRMARELKATGRLSVSEADVNGLSDGAAFPVAGGETLFGFSVRELASKDAPARSRAAERLAALGQKAAAPALVSALHSELDPSTQVALLKALAVLGAPTAVPAVRPLLAARPAEVRIAALKTLLALEPAAAGPHLAAATSDPDPAVRRRASLLALSLPGRAALELGSTAIRDADPAVRALAALVLGASHAEVVRPLLLEALRDADAKVRRSASQALSNLLGHDVTPVGLTDAHRRREVRRLKDLEPVPLAHRRPRLAQSVAPPRSTAPIATTASSRVEERAQQELEAAPLPVRPARPAALTPRRVPEASLEAAARPLSAPARVAVVEREASTPGLDGRLLGELRASLRGKSLPDLAQAVETSQDEVMRGLGALLSRGAVVRRGLKYFVA